LQAADGILNLAGCLVGLAFGFELGVSGHLAGNFLDRTLGLFGGSLDPVFVHVALLIATQGQRLGAQEVPCWGAPHVTAVGASASMSVTTSTSAGRLAA